MNIKGVQLLKEKGLPVMENLFIFRTLEEIPKEHLGRYEDKKLWAMRGFDDRTQISDSPYNIKDVRYHGFSKDELENVFVKINEELEKKEIPKENRIFLIARVFYDEDVEFSGHVFRENDYIYVDILKGNRPSGRDWTPHVSFKIKVVNNAPLISSIEENELKKPAIELCEDILKFGNKAYLDFTKFRKGYFFYHDLSVH
jgi:hypothetical protein